MLEKTKSIVYALLFVVLLVLVLIVVAQVLVYLFENRVEIKPKQDPYRVPDYSAQEAF